MATTDGLIGSNHDRGRRGGERCPSAPPAASLQGTNPQADIDGLSSSWCDAGGRLHPAVDAAIHAQLESSVLDSSAGIDQPGRALARRLTAIAPGELQRVIYADSGGGALALAIELARGASTRRGDVRRTEVICPPNDGDLEARLVANGDRVAAVVVEPLVRAAAGMRLQAPGHLRRVRDLCDEHGALLICDETATCFGRTGAMFACDLEQVVPDLMCVAGALTGDRLPLAATLASAAIDAVAQTRATPDPIACAAAIATLRMFESEHTLALLGPKIELLARLLEQRIAVLPGVAEVRHRGMMVGIELVIGPADERLAQRAVLAARRRGAVIGCDGNVIVLTPALAISEPDLRRLMAITASSIAEAYVGRLTGSPVTLRRA